MATVFGSDGIRSSRKEDGNEVAPGSRSGWDRVRRRNPGKVATTTNITSGVADHPDRRPITEFLKREGQFLLPMAEPVEGTAMDIDEGIDRVGRATLGACWIPHPGSGNTPR